MGPVLVKQPERLRVAALAAALAPLGIAVFFGAWSLRGLGSGTPTDTDAARHAMNGVFIHDLLRHGVPVPVVAFAKSYYSRYPSLSMPYHPPLFPAFEALFLFVLGVNYFAARVAIAVTTALAAWLLYKLALRTHGSQAFAAVSTILFFSLSSSVILASDVMLEMPTLVLILAAMHLLPGLDGGWGLRRGMAFALTAAAAVWTKQNAVFLGLVPFVYAAFERRWRALVSAALLIPACVFGAFVVALAALAMVIGITGNRQWPPFRPLPILSHNVPYYADVMREEFGAAGVVLIAIAILAALAMLRGRGVSRENVPYLAWAACVFAVAFLMPPYDFRYIFFAYPALAIVVSSVLHRAGLRLLPAKFAWTLPAALAAAWFATHITTSPYFVRGPAETAKLLAPVHAERILYCGRSNGNFIFALRALDPELRSATIRGDKLPRGIFQDGAFEKFAHDYGIQFVVMERSLVQRPWDRLFESAPESFELVRELPLSSSDRLMNGRLRVFRFSNPSPTPLGTLELRALGMKLDAELPAEETPAR